MTSIFRALPWAIAMILIALGEDYGLVDPRSAQTMFVILPALAVIGLVGNGTCRPLFRRGGREGASQ